MSQRAFQLWVIGCLLCASCAPARQPPGASAAPLPDSERREQPVSAADLEILIQADALLSDERGWNRHDTRECPQAEAASLSLFCALRAACTRVLGQYDHRRVALQEVRFAIEEVSGGREFEHRLMDFNNLEATTFADIKRVLAIARGRVQHRLDGQVTR